ncbi:MAG: hypothetical protein C5B49_09275, partial [Bdellovibrio sp.]
MNFEDLKERLKAAFQSIMDRLQENENYISLRDRFAEFSPQKQKAIIFGSIGFVLLLLFAIPFSTYQSASDQIGEYEAKKDLIRELLRAHKEAAENPLSVSPPSMGEVRSQIEAAIQSLNLLPEQNRGILVQPPGGSLVKNSIIEGVYEISTVQLNLTQIINLGTSLVKIQGTKLKDLVMRANAKDPRYFDTSFRLIVFKGESPDLPIGGGGAGGGG